MRSRLLLSTAVLIASIGVASAQHAPGGGASPSPGGSPGGAATPSQPQSSPTQREPGKQGQSQGKQGQKGETTGQAPQGQAQPKAKGKEEGGQPHGQTTGQGKQPSGQAQPGAQSPTTGQAPQRQPQPGQAPQGQAQPGQTPQAGGGVTLTTEQRTKIRETVLTSAPRVSNVNFSLSVGTAVPTSVRVVEVHPTLVEIHPEWRGFSYFVVGDQIIIVDRSHRIVAVIAV
jgi:hypothetical protein